MRKPIIIFVIGLLIILAFTLGAYAADPIKLIVNGQEMKPAVPPQVINGSTMVPVRFVSEALGATVEWDEPTQSVYISGSAKSNSANVQTVLARNMFPDVLINSAYLSIGIPNNPTLGQQQALFDMLVSKEMEMFDGVHILYETANGQVDRRITISTYDATAWKMGLITGEEFASRWQDTARTSNVLPAAPSSTSPSNSEIEAKRTQLQAAIREIKASAQAAREQVNTDFKRSVDQTNQIYDDLLEQLPALLNARGQATGGLYNAKVKEIEEDRKRALDDIELQKQPYLIRIDNEEKNALAPLEWELEQL